MLHLAIECSALAGSVAVLRQQTVIDQRVLPPAVGSVQTLAPAVAELLAPYNALGNPPVGLISVTHGPGSFTGLRGGMALAKMLGLAWQIPLVAVGTLHVMAAQTAHEVTSRNQLAQQDTAQQSTAQQSSAHQSTGRGGIGGETPAIIVSVLNAFRKQVFVCAWRIAAASHLKPAVDLIPLAQPQVLSAQQWQAQPLAALVGLDGEQLARSDRSSKDAESSSNTASHLNLPVWISGAGLRNYTPQLDGDMTLADPAHWDPTAGWVGRLGWQSYLAGQAVSAAQLAPNYVRCSAAEETRAALS